MDSLLKLNDKDLIKKGLSLGGEFSKYAVNVYKVYNKENVDPELLDIVEEQVEDSTIKQQKKKGNSEKHSRVKVEDNQSEAGLSR
jgi:protein involved in sex pheromone biosynthesis